MLRAYKDPEERLRSLEGKKIGNLTLTVPTILRPKGREKECRYFQLKGLKDGKTSINSMIEGLYSVGRASINLSSYFDIDYCYLIFFEGGEVVDLTVEGVDLDLFKLLSTLVDQGGKIIVSLTSPYKLPLLEETFKQLDRGVQPQDTYLGRLLLKCGCGYAFKLWLIREGGAEGSVALQGEKTPIQ
ncbi:MAG: DUF1122 family protein [Nitrososphaerales archaeon]